MQNAFVLSRHQFLNIHFLFRETLLGQLTVYVKSIRDDFISRTQNSYSGNKDGSGPPQGQNMPEIVNNIVWVRQLDSKVCVVITFYCLFSDILLVSGTCIQYMLFVMN